MSAYEGFADVYDELMNDVDYDAWSQYLIRLIEAHLPEPAVPAVADLACGTGAFCMRFAKRGYRVIGVDCSADMLRIAGQKARSSGLSIPFVQQDMRALTLHKPVDVVTVCCDGVNYLSTLADADAFFAAAYRSLVPGGLLLFDVSSAYKLTHILDGQTFGDVTEDCTYLWQNCFDKSSRCIEMALTFFVREGERYRRFDETHIQRAYTQAEIDALLTKNGFTVLGCFAAFTDAAPAADTERIQWIAKRSPCQATR